MSLFNRDISLQVGDRLIRSRANGSGARPTLRVQFKVEKSGSTFPNASDVALYNLSARNRGAFQQRGTAVLIDAGYVGATSRLGSGTVRFGQSSRQGPDWITRLQMGDGTKEFRSARVNENFNAGAQIKDVIIRVAESLGVGLGNLRDKLNTTSFRGNLTEFAKGMVVSGSSSGQLTKLMRSVGLQWSIQEGQIQALAPRESTSQTAIRLAPDSGLIGAPELGEDGILKARSLLQAKLTPGRKVEVIANNVDGFFSITKVVHTGDTWGDDWFSDIEGTPV